MQKWFYIKYKNGNLVANINFSYSQIFDTLIQNTFINATKRVILNKKTILLSSNIIKCKSFKT
jgi:hypothetical protein